MTWRRVRPWPSSWSWPYATPGCSKRRDGAKPRSDLARDRAPEDRGGMSGQPFHHLREDNRAPEALQAGHAPVGDAAGHDQGEGGEVGGDVEGEAMGGDPARDAHPNGADLLLTHPDPGEPGNPSGLNPVVPAGADQHLLQVADVAVNVAPIGREVQDPRCHHLTRPVVGDVPPAAGLEHIEAPRPEGRLGA